MSSIKLFGNETKSCLSLVVHKPSSLASILGHHTFGSFQFKRMKICNSCVSIQTYPLLANSLILKCTGIEYAESVKNSGSSSVSVRK